jgi:hypothetical protein
MNPFWRLRKVLIIAFALLAAMAAALSGALVLGSHRWNAETQGLRARLDAARLPVRPQTVSFRELEGLPAPVQSFFRAVLTDGQPMVAEVHMRHTGTFNMGEAADRWKPW